MDLPLISMRRLLWVRGMPMSHRNSLSQLLPVSLHQVSPLVGMMTSTGALHHTSR